MRTRGKDRERWRVRTRGKDRERWRVRTRGKDRERWRVRTRGKDRERWRVRTRGQYTNFTKTIYRRSGNFHVKNNSRKKFSCRYIFVIRSIREIFLTIDGYNMDKCLEHS